MGIIESHRNRYEDREHQNGPKVSKTETETEPSTSFIWV